ncbi:major capsid protein [Cytobacillus firmus]|uniref:major capsid protein n=1 Tax=Cytobacillus firmus TaxID=1399 RepID=UPI0018CF77E6|nr:major capsid protein [Cytobacillus firmus]MBG9548393.1 phage capsid protein [Cytobacillus firmus]MBG9604515.1 phage capsid protein [Cytobacillus firmus]MED1942131.1 major capsid protein [Cytobacillus firmus]
MNLNYYKTQTILSIVEQLPPVRTFLKDTFFPDGETFVTEDVLIDVKKGKRKMAPFVAPRVGGVTIERDGFSTDKYKAPKIAPQRALTVDDLMVRGLGENVFSNRTPEQRQVEFLIKDIRELQDMTARRLEWLAAQVLFYGKAVLKGYIDYQNKDFVDQTLDYQFTNKVTLSGTDLWGNGGSIYDQLEEWQIRVVEATDEKPKNAIFGRDALKAFRNDAEIKEMMNIRNMNFGEIKPEIRGNGVSFIGRLPELGLDIYTYDAWYVDEDNISKPYVPKDHIALANDNLGETLYGAITQMEKDVFKTYEGKNIPKTWADNSADARMVRLSTRPVPKPHDVDSWLVAKVV